MCVEIVEVAVMPPPTSREICPSLTMLMMFWFFFVSSSSSPLAPPPPGVQGLEASGLPTMHPARGNASPPGGSAPDRWLWGSGKTRADSSLSGSRTDRVRAFPDVRGKLFTAHLCQRRRRERRSWGGRAAAALPGSRRRRLLLGSGAGDGDPGPWTWTSWGPTTSPETERRTAGEQNPDGASGSQRLVY